jgi:hypothetical protein
LKGKNGKRRQRQKEKMQNATNIKRKKCKTPLRTAVKIVNASNNCQQEGMI